VPRGVIFSIRSSMLGMILLICLSSSIHATSPVGVLYTGDPYPGLTPYVYMKVEPLLSVTPIQASRDHYAGISQEDIRRAIRMYMPRTYKSLVENYDVVIISDSNVGSFTPEQLKWFNKAVSEHGTGLVMIGGHETFGGAAGNPDWGPTPVGEVLPVQTISDAYEGGKLTISGKGNPFIDSLPWKPDLPFLRRYDCNVVKPREGAEILAIDRIDSGAYAGWNNPFFSTWEYPPGTKRSRVFAMTGDWTPGGGWVFLHWEYLPDFATNLMLYCSHRPIPKDLQLVHTVRTRMATLSYRRIILSSLVDFVEKFGANPRKLLLAADEVDAAKKHASELYLDQRFDEALQATGEALDLMDKAEALSEKVKREALMWVYLVEWLTVTATSLMVAFLIWTLMIRRRLYREVRTTQFRTR